MTSRVTIPFKLDEFMQEAYCSLRTNLQFCGLGSNLKTIAVTSCHPNEGKTTVSLNLAVSITSIEKRVLLVDTDLRKPRNLKEIQHNYNYGLSNYLSHMADFEEVICNTNIKLLHMALCGPKPPNPAELLATARFEEFISEARKNYDVVIFDTPPLGSVIDAAIIAPKTDGTIFVIESNTVDYKMAQRVKEQLQRSNSKVIGAVLNKLGKKNFKDYHSSYNYYNKVGIEKTS